MGVGLKDPTSWGAIVLLRKHFCASRGVQAAYTRLYPQFPAFPIGRSVRYRVSRRVFDRGVHSLNVAQHPFCDMIMPACQVSVPLSPFLKVHLSMGLFSFLVFLNAYSYNE